MILQASAKTTSGVQFFQPHVTADTRGPIPSPAFKPCILSGTKMAIAKGGLPWLKAFLWALQRMDP